MIRALIQRIKLPANQRKNYSKLKNILGFSPRKWDYYQLALTHSSTYNSNKSRLQNNERLEFLGDSVLGTIVSEILYENYSNKREGELTNLRSKIVQRATLDDLAVRIGLNKLVTSQEHTAQFKAHINGNAFEALMGAIFMDRGYKKSKKFILKLIKEKHIDIEKLSKKEINFKSFVDQIPRFEHLDMSKKDIKDIYGKLKENLPKENILKLLNYSILKFCL